jgi:hypothetical protein
MKAAAVLIVVSAAGLAALPVASCSVHRLSDGYTCDPAGNGSECGSDRFCDQGFCVESGSTDMCPGQCNSCDVMNRTCRIECNQGQTCGNVQCPAGYDCTIRCNSDEACGDIDCAQAHSCDVTCSGSEACGHVNCGPNECSIRCSGALACPMIDCAASCSCDVNCNDPTSCPSMACPKALGPCTHNGSDGAACDSSQPGCGICF